MVKVFTLHIHRAWDNIAHKWHVVDYLQKDAKRKGALRHGVSRTVFKSFWHNLESVISDERDLYVATNDSNKMVGFMVVRCLGNNRKGDKVNLSFMEILPAYRSKGAGRVMVQYVIDTARLEGQSSIELVAANGSDGFWDKMGFQVTPKSSCLYSLSL
jgi:GNAT superfamily N-acetyltransferase